jgi:hypothetical protein
MLCKLQYDEMFSTKLFMKMDVFRDVVPYSLMDIDRLQMSISNCKEHHLRRQTSSYSSP